MFINAVSGSDHGPSRVGTVVGGDESLNRDDEPTVVCLKIPETYKGRIFVMIDNGSDKNLIKRSSFLPHVPIDFTKNNISSGITDQLVNTYGTATLTIVDEPETFQVVADDFPIEQEALIGRGFLKRNKAIVNSHHNTLILKRYPLKPIPFHSIGILRSPGWRTLGVRKKSHKGNTSSNQRKKNPKIMKVSLEPRAKTLILTTITCPSRVRERACSEMTN